MQLDSAMCEQRQINQKNPSKTELKRSEAKRLPDIRNWTELEDLAVSSFMSS